MQAVAIVMRAVMYVVETGRKTIVCTIYQPSIDMFEAFDEVIFFSQSRNVKLGFVCEIIILVLNAILVWLNNMILQILSC